MNTSFERSANASDEWYTPREIIEALGEFDLDPCAPMHPLWPTAKIMYNKQDNGLIQNWGGRIWLNPPYSKPLIWQFVEKLAEHGNGIASSKSSGVSWKDIPIWRIFPSAFFLSTKPKASYFLHFS